MDEGFFPQFVLIDVNRQDLEKPIMINSIIFVILFYYYLISYILILIVYYLDIWLYRKLII